MILKVLILLLTGRKFKICLNNFLLTEKLVPNSYFSSFVSLSSFPLFRHVPRLIVLLRNYSFFKVRLLALRSTLLFYPGLRVALTVDGRLNPSTDCTNGSFPFLFIIQTFVFNTHIKNSITSTKCILTINSIVRSCLMLRVGNVYNIYTSTIYYSK